MRDKGRCNDDPLVFCSLMSEDARATSAQAVLELTIGGHGTEVAVKTARAYTSAEFGEALHRIECDPAIRALSLLASPSGEQVAQLYKCLKRAPHVTTVSFDGDALEQGGAEDWLAAIPSSAFVDVNAGVSLSAPFLLRLAESRLRRFGVFEAEPLLVEFVETNALTQLEWFWSSTTVLSQEQLACRMMRRVSQLTSFVFAHWRISQGILATLAKALFESPTLTSLDISDPRNQGADLDALWTALRDSSTCVLRALVIQSAHQGFQGLEGFLATTHARTHLTELELTGCDPRSAPNLLLAIALNGRGLKRLNLGFEAFVLKLDTAKTETATQELIEHTNAPSCLTRFTFTRADIGGDSHGELDKLFFAFLSYVARTSPDLLLLDLNNQEDGPLWRFHKAILPTVGTLRMLALDFTILGEREHELTDGAEIVSALNQNRVIESLIFCGVRDTLALSLTRWIVDGAPTTLTRVSLNLETVAPSVLVHLILSLARCASLTHLRLFDKRDDSEALANDTRCSAAIIKLLGAVKSLRSLVVDANCFLFLSQKVADSESSHESLQLLLRRAVLAHTALEHTNLLTSRPVSLEDAAVLEGRRLRRHRLAAHWAQISLLLAFTRNQALELQGSILPLLPVIGALAGLVLPKHGWIQSFTHSTFFTRHEGAGRQTRKRKHQ